MVQRYKFESKSQQDLSQAGWILSCFQWFKDTNLKVNHNSKTLYSPIIMLFPMVQRYKFESKSQPFFSGQRKMYRCFQWFKDTNLKVNHNNFAYSSW